ncbi:hypothetical protein [Legionella gresilensis]|uniref:hypothetical protein n=1 Tax=Legionella gresilensis TaxID=91823 RepID=UPI001F5E6FDE|nr:hypothetical protein [Legionella gresilensis]
MAPDIIFIGAGPIGLLGAIQLKLQCPYIDILMFEKYKTPLRNHAMYIDHSSFADMDRSQGFGEVLDNIPAKVLISDLEIMLRQYAESIEIKIQYEEIKDFNELKNQYPTTNYFVGSGGLRGIIHPQVFNSENQINDALRYAVEVKYKAIGKTRSLNKVTEIPGILSYTNNLVSEYVGRLKDGLTPISLRIFIDELTYQVMKEATFKNPYTLADQEKFPAELFKTINTYLQARKHLANELIARDSLKISTITLSLYASKYFCKEVDGKVIFKIGEEAFACPFYRSFNDNAFCIPFFTKAMKALFEETKVEVKKFSASYYFKVSAVEKEPLDYYQHDLQAFVNREVRTIHFLNSGIDILESSVATSQSLPKVSTSLRLKPAGRMFIEEVNKENDNAASKDKPSSAKFKCTII